MGLLIHWIQPIISLNPMVAGYRALLFSMSQFTASDRLFGLRCLKKNSYWKLHFGRPRNGIFVESFQVTSPRNTHRNQNFDEQLTGHKACRIDWNRTVPHSWLVPSSAVEHWELCECWKITDLFIIGSLFLKIQVLLGYVKACFSMLLERQGNGDWIKFNVVNGSVHLLGTNLTQLIHVSKR